MSTKQTYIRCPRCELNYILKKDKFCSVCKAEMQVGGGELDDSDMELCPICKTNYIGSDEVMCPTCMQERNFNPDSDESVEDWEAYVNRDENDDFVAPDEETGDMASVKDLDDDDTDFDDDDLVFSDHDDDDFDDDDKDSYTDDDDDDDFDDDFDDYDDDDDYDEDDEDDDDYEDDDDDEKPKKKRK